jgi:ABC-type Fe3+ transport system substrate-binding protein
MAFEDVLAGFEVKFVAPKNAFVTAEPIAVLAGAKHPRAARAFIAFLLTERGQRVFMERGLFPLLPKYKVQGPTGSVAETAVAFTGGVRSYFETEMTNVYDADVAEARYQQVNERFRREIEAAWDQLKR